MIKENKAILSDAGVLFDKITDARLMHDQLEATTSDGLNLYRLWQIANGLADDDTLHQISQNFTARRQFKAILAQKAQAFQPRQAAASSDSNHRHGTDFDVQIMPSASQDGLVYVQLIFHQDQAQQDTSAKMLISHCNGVFRQKPLTTPQTTPQTTSLTSSLTSSQDQRIQILLHHDDPMLTDLRNPETELYIK
ncbi:MAG: hypothetical protein CBC12_02390 [Candidatus Puniceispirillum sp. TMED52]|nr:hypothetical protein [SAR116 cluster bacterium]OUU53701.1 MAG: hypothetical protein CBC12_02390 [Candidatus Puniceispirillum sp. TMED52]HCP19493.1 hypothetical protein [Alphaproteobacteria bacterium]